jgi:hypothetical protein
VAGLIRNSLSLMSAEMWKGDQSSKKGICPRAKSFPQGYQKRQRGLLTR